MKYNDLTRWYIVANRSQAVIYSEDEKHQFNLVTRFFNSDARRSERELDRDRPGSQSGPGSIHHSLDRKFHRHQQVGLNFAHRISQFVEHAGSTRQFDELVLVAGPGFLGFLRQMLSNESLKKVRVEVAREFVHQSDEELRQSIREAVKNKQMRGERSYENRSTA